jgi:protein involved in ribonucleotide reduction
MTDVVFFSSGSRNTLRFVEALGFPAVRIPASAKEALPEVKNDYILICPTYADGEGRGAVPKPVIRFLNDPCRREKLKGVIGTGNRNFGVTFALAGKIIARKCHVPLLDRIELAGTGNDIDRVRAILETPLETSHA